MPAFRKVGARDLLFGQREHVIDGRLRGCKRDICAIGQTGTRRSRAAMPFDFERERSRRAGRMSDRSADSRIERWRRQGRARRRSIGPRRAVEPREIDCPRGLIRQRDRAQSGVVAIVPRARAVVDARYVHPAVVQGDMTIVARIDIGEQGQARCLGFITECHAVAEPILDPCRQQPDLLAVDRCDDAGLSRVRWPRQWRVGVESLPG